MKRVFLEIGFAVVATLVICAGSYYLTGLAFEALFPVLDGIGKLMTVTMLFSIGLWAAFVGGTLISVIRDRRGR